MYTTGIIAKKNDAWDCVLYFTGHKYSGENVSDLLEERENPRLVSLMSDALPTNNPKLCWEVYHYLCLAHGRRKFIDLGELFEKESQFVLDQISEVYKNEKHCKDKKLSPLERLAYHQRYSQKVMENLKDWCEKALSEKNVEPNSSLGKGIKYLLKHWEGLSGFLRDGRAPLDNNVLESELRVPVMNRKNWLFYKTEQGALVGDIILSLIKTCIANKVDAFSYLTHLQKNAEKAQSNPAEFLPWEIASKLEATKN